jgi:hypothetical protein
MGSFLRGRCISVRPRRAPIPALTPLAAIPVGVVQASRIHDARLLAAGEAQRHGLRGH